MADIISSVDIKNALINRIGIDEYNKIESATVAVCGLGGLGSNISICLARAGVGNLILIDFDKVDVTNLNRQQYNINQVGINKTDALKSNLKAIAPQINITTITDKLDESNICKYTKDADIICEAFDNAEAKSMLIDAVSTYMPDKFLVAASGMAGLFDPNNIRTRKITDHFYLCGDGTSDIKDIALYSTGAMICAAHEAHTVLRIITGNI